MKEGELGYLVNRVRRVEEAVRLLESQLRELANNVSYVQRKVTMLEKELEYVRSYLEHYAYYCSVIATKLREV